MSITKYGIFVIFSILMASSCLSALEGSKSKGGNRLDYSLNEFGINLSMDKNVQVGIERPVEDFVIYKYKFQDQVMVLYVGNQPDFVTQETTDEVDINGSTVSRCLVKTDDKYSGEYLFNLSKYKDFPQYLHFSFSNAPQNAKDVFKDIIHSVRLEID